MTYGKFATAEELLKGYVELEKSFTQKCQQLAALKETMQAKAAPTSEQVAKTEQAKAAPTSEQVAKTAPTSQQVVQETQQAKVATTIEQVAKETEQFFENILQDETLAEIANDGTNVETSPSAAEQSTTVDSAVTVPQSGQDASVLDGHATAPVAPTDEQLQQYLKNNPKVILQLLQQSSEFAPTVMSGGGNVSLAMPSRPKTIKEASLMAKNLFN